MTTRTTLLDIPDLLGLVTGDQLHRYMVPGGHPAPTPAIPPTAAEPPAHPRATIPPPSLDEPTAYALAQEAARRKVTVEALIVDIVENWIRQVGGGGDSSGQAP